MNDIGEMIMSSLAAKTFLAILLALAIGCSVGVVVGFWLVG